MAQQRMMEQFDARHRLQQIKVNDQVWVDGPHLTLPGDRGLKPKLLEQRSQRQFRDCEVVTVDILPKWQATRTEDILHWNYKLYPRHHFDAIWASPPCREYIKAKTRGAPDLKLADRRCTHTTTCPARATLGKHENTAQEGISASNARGMGSAQAVYAIPRALLHHLFCELKLGERMKEENALAVMDLISTLTARMDESETQDTEASQPGGAKAAEDL
eukprot:gene10769-biopygen11025